MRRNALIRPQERLMRIQSWEKRIISTRVQYSRRMNVEHVEIEKSYDWNDDERPFKMNVLLLYARERMEIFNYFYKNIYYLLSSQNNNVVPAGNQNKNTVFSMIGNRNMMLRYTDRVEKRTERIIYGKYVRNWARKKCSAAATYSVLNDE